jgi:nitroreductase
MTDAPSSVLRPLRQVHQTRQFAPDAPIPAEAIDAIVDVARWSGSSQNTQPWRFITLQETATLRAMAELIGSNARSLETAPAAIAIVMPVAEGKAVSYAFDEARAAERMIIAASLLGLAAGLSWIAAPARPAVADLLGIPDGWSLRSIVAMGQPAGGRSGTPRGRTRLPRAETVFSERWGG